MDLNRKKPPPSEEAWGIVCSPLAEKRVMSYLFKHTRKAFHLYTERAIAQRGTPKEIIKDIYHEASLSMADAAQKWIEQGRPGGIKGREIGVYLIWGIRHYFTQAISAQAANKVKMTVPDPNEDPYERMRLVEMREWNGPPPWHQMEEDDLRRQVREGIKTLSNDLRSWTTSLLKTGSIREADRIHNRHKTWIYRDGRFEKIAKALRNTGCVDYI